ncbi:AbrB/MazE/SpoVT family DNA-binding domain-containing protein [Ancylobacter sp. FA202]|uniref:AbrB/MazE/SpoVT family DNA-binding domain-containing protein n=1 Tax=Ancylobacter sp. FA202 TaxID=1111106 RepID=UPI00037CDD4F|nr:AbrB/MazE/SpoVT family DNA-binding domain-containing protein [Ancylobacter sp. FA202]
MVEQHQSPAKEVRLFRNNRSQAVRIPVEFELPGDRALISREGDRIIIEPVRQSTGLLALLATWEPLDEEFPTIEDRPAEPEDVF